MDEKNQLNGLRRIFLIVIDVILFNLSIWLSFYLKFNGNIPDFNFEAYESTAVYITIFFVLMSLLLGAYIYYNRTVGDIVFITIIEQLITFSILIVITFMGRWFSFPRSVLFYSFLISTIFLGAFRMLAYHFYIKLTPVKKVAVFGDKEDVDKAIRNFSTTKNKKHRITDVVLSNEEKYLDELLPKVDVFYLTNPNLDSKVQKRLIEKIVKSEKRLFLPTNFDNLVLTNPNMMNFDDESVIDVSPFRIPLEKDIVKRFFDIVVSLIGLIVLSPILIITAILVKVTSPGPVFYSQVRITMNQKEFKILKFRTMSATAEKNSGPVLAKANDARVTPIGKYLRKLRIDEIPQFINVLKGDMSIIGPRPERPFFVEQFNKEDSSYYLRHNVRAGITGYAQVYGKYASDFKAKLQFDLLYIKDYSLLLDFKILLQTIKILFDKVSSQGLDESEETVEEINYQEKNIQLHQ